MINQYETPQANPPKRPSVLEELDSIVRIPLDEVRRRMETLIPPDCRHPDVETTIQNGLETLQRLQEAIHDDLPGIDLSGEKQDSLRVLARLWRDDDIGPGIPCGSTEEIDPLAAADRLMARVFMTYLDQAANYVVRHLQSHGIPECSLSALVHTMGDNIAHEQHAGADRELFHLGLIPYFMRELQRVSDKRLRTQKYFAKTWVLLAIQLGMAKLFRADEPGGGVHIPPWLESWNVVQISEENEAILAELVLRKMQQLGISFPEEDTEGATAM